MLFLPYTPVCTAGGCGDFATPDTVFRWVSGTEVEISLPESVSRMLRIFCYERLEVLKLNLSRTSFSKRK